jgi:hypothetical protein
MSGAGNLAKPERFFIKSVGDNLLFSVSIASKNVSVVV